MTLEVRLLGAIEVYRDGRRVELPGDRLRTLLAYLALAPGTSRSIDGIVDALWPDAELGGEMPADPRQTVHTYASRTRQALGPASVISRDGGYALMVAPLDVDVPSTERVGQQTSGIRSSSQRERRCSSAFPMGSGGRHRWERHCPGVGKQSAPLNRYRDSGEVRE